MATGFPMEAELWDLNFFKKIDKTGQEIPAVSKSSGSYRPEYASKVCVRCGTEVKSFGPTVSHHPNIVFFSISQSPS